MLLVPTEQLAKKTFSCLSIVPREDAITPMHDATAMPLQRPLNGTNQTSQKDVFSLLLALLVASKAIQTIATMPLQKHCSL